MDGDEAALPPFPSSQSVLESTEMIAVASHHMQHNNPVVGFSHHEFPSFSPYESQPQNSLFISHSFTGIPHFDSAVVDIQPDVVVDCEKEDHSWSTGQLEDLMDFAEAATPPLSNGQLAIGDNTQIHWSCQSKADLERFSFAQSLTHHVPGSCKIVDRNLTVWQPYSLPLTEVAVSSSSQCNNKHRMRWTQELHEAFVDSVNQLGGSERATPRGVLRLMNVNGLTIYHVKSHLQKYRTARVRPESSEGNSEDKTSAIEKLSPIDLKTSMTITEALRMQMKVQKQLHEQLEIQRKLQLRIEEQGKYLLKMLESRNKVEDKSKAIMLKAASRLPSPDHLKSLPSNVDFLQPGAVSGSSNHAVNHQLENDEFAPRPPSRKRAKMDKYLR